MKISKSDIKQLINHLLTGRVVYMLTDTIPGLAAAANSPTAIEELYRLKKRDLDKPPIIIVSDLLQLPSLGINLEPKQIKATKIHWPGPTSLILPTNSGGAQTHLNRGEDTLAVRLTDKPDLVAVIEQVGPLATSSANYQDDPPANNPAEARAYFGDQLAYYADHPPLHNPRPSTIIRINDDGSEIIIR